MLKASIAEAAVPLDTSRNVTQFLSQLRGLKSDAREMFSSQYRSPLPDISLQHSLFTDKSISGTAETSRPRGSIIRKMIPHASPEAGISPFAERRAAEFYASVERGKALQREGERVARCTTS